MKKICLVDSTYPINTRTNKIYKSLVKEYGYDFVYVIAWNRDGRNIEDNGNYFIFNRKAAYGSKIQKFINLLSFQKFIRKIFFNTKFDIVIASHWETLFLISKLKTKDMTLIYENLDIPTAENKCVLKILQYIEKMALRKTDAIVFASRFFAPLYSFYKKEKLILENKPDGKFLPQQDKKT